MKGASVAARYARALFIVTERRNETPDALEDLKRVGVVLGPDTRASALLAAPQVLLADKRRVVARTLEGRCTRSVALFVDLLLRKKRLGELARIVSEFEALVERKQGVRRAHAVSAVPLEETERRRLHAELERITAATVKLDVEVDARLIGGMLVRIGDRVIDRTVKTLLDSMKQRLHEARV